MMEQKKKYEAMYLINNSLGEETVQGLVAKFTDLISANGEIIENREWGVRKLAYPIEDLSEAYYVLVKFESGHDFPNELKRVFNITDGILRSLVVVCEE